MWAIKYKNEYLTEFGWSKNKFICFIKKENIIDYLLFNIKNTCH